MGEYDMKKSIFYTGGNVDEPDYIVPPGLKKIIQKHVPE